VLLEARREVFVLLLDELAAAVTRVPPRLLLREQPAERLLRGCCGDVRRRGLRFALEAELLASDVVVLVNFVNEAFELLLQRLFLALEGQWFVPLEIR